MRVNKIDTQTYNSKNKFKYKQTTFTGNLNNFNNVAKPLFWYLAGSFSAIGLMDYFAKRNKE